MGIGRSESNASVSLLVDGKVVNLDYSLARLVLGTATKKLNNGSRVLLSTNSSQSGKGERKSFIHTFYI